jgi:hypothetical protein
MRRKNEKETKKKVLKMIVAKIALKKEKRFGKK